MKLLVSAAAAATCLALASPAAAQITQLTSTGQIATTYVNDFETVRDSGPVTWNAGSLNSAGSYAGNVTTSGAQGLASDTFPQTLTANLSSFYNAVGLNFGNDDTCCSSGFSAILTVWSGATNLGSVTVAANMNDFVDQFIGLSSVTAFDRVDISYGSNAELYTFIDDFRLGSAATGAVPEPSTCAMMLLCFGAIGYSMRRRRKSGAVPVFA